MNKTIEKAKSQIEAGRLWRAKEILRGTIAQRPFTAELYEEYGRVLLSLGDMYEAGKYLFLAGNHIDEYREAIDLYLSRNKNKDYRQLYSSFPSRARLGIIDKYPEQTRAKLEKLCFPRNVSSLKPHAQPVGSKARVQAFFASVIGISILLVIIAGFLHGLYAIGRWLTALFR